ncbi:MAG: xanthine dehydrogenase family protein subunit M [Candidatus Hadarchaeales archaeon]
MMTKFDYHRPSTVEEAVGLLEMYGEEAKVFAGGTDLFVLMRDRILRPKHVVDLKGVKELGEISYSERAGLRIGATATLAQLLKSEIVKEKFHVLWDAARVLADPILRQRATLVGNICNASPAADTAPALLVLNAEVEVAGKAGVRRVPIRQFFVGVKRTIVGPNELVTAVIIPEPPKGSVGRYLKWGRTRGEDLAIVGVALLVADGGRDVRIALSSVYKTPILIEEVGKIFREEGPVEEKIKKAVETVRAKISPISDVRASREYRLHMAGVLVERGLKELLGVK